MGQHAAGKDARKIINDARSKIFSTFQLPESDHKLMFPSGATESIAAFAHSFAQEARLRGKELLICFSPLDHSAVTALVNKPLGAHVAFLELELNLDLTYNFERNFELIQQKKQTHPDLLILYHHLWVHNETGLVSGLSGLKKLKTIPDLFIHVDAVQAPGKVADWQRLSAGDIWTFSPHKFGSMKGIGFSLSKNDVPFHPFITGGGQQQRSRAGTENTMAIQSIHLALNDLEKVNVLENKKKRDDLELFLNDELKGIGGVLTQKEVNSNTIYFYLNSLSSDLSLALFDLNGLMLSAGSACTSGAAKPSQVLLKSGHAAVAKNGLRLSLGFHPSEEELSHIKKSLKLIFAKIRSHST